LFFQHKWVRAQVLAVFEPTHSLGLEQIWGIQNPEWSLMGYTVHRGLSWTLLLDKREGKKQVQMRFEA